MLDNKLFEDILKMLKAGIQANYFVDVDIPNTVTKQSYQPTQEGVLNKPTLYVHKIDDHRYGWQGRKDTWNQDESKMVHTENQKMESRFQVSALVTQNPKTPGQLTASDLVNCAAGILQSLPALEYLRSRGIGIERIIDVRNPYFIDDKNQNAASPNFDFVLTHNQDIMTEVPVIQSVEYNFKRV